MAVERMGFMAIVNAGPARVKWGSQRQRGRELTRIGVEKQLSQDVKG